ncbi:MAG: hypothetical protein CXT73_02570 [Methanobacteriota archaeon]|nr:MAG: hypothetical protein CXT73_02570 [Euryarchaeota archaeon]
MNIMNMNKRIFVKTLSYRFWVMVSLILTGIIFMLPNMVIIKLTIACWTVGLVLFFIHEKLWSKFKVFRIGKYDTHKRTLIKTISWRVLALVAVTLLGLLFGLSSEQSVGYSIVSNVMFVGVHYIHERVWNVVNWGKNELVHT